MDPGYTGSMDNAITLTDEDKALLGRLVKEEIDRKDDEGWESNEEREQVISLLRRINSRWKRT